jgi:Double zinc ribbon/Phospholipase_D-nuclease N-terminal
MIPRWSVFLAIVVFIAAQYLFHHVMPHRHPEMLPMRLLMGYSSGTAFASYVLLVGYVSRDVKRRNMSPALWLLIVILMPGGIGGVVYFLLRQPILSRCPHCSTEITSSFHFCPQCQFQIAPVCGQCFRGVEITDVYCTHCGHDLAEDHSPARLRAYSD